FRTCLFLALATCAFAGYLGYPAYSSYSVAAPAVATYHAAPLTTYAHAPAFNYGYGHGLYGYGLGLGYGYGLGGLGYGGFYKKSRCGVVEFPLRRQPGSLIMGGATITTEKTHHLSAARHDEPPRLIALTIHISGTLSKTAPHPRKSASPNQVVLHHGKGNPPAREKKVKRTKDVMKESGSLKLRDCFPSYMTQPDYLDNDAKNNRWEIIGFATVAHAPSVGYGYGVGHLGYGGGHLGFGHGLGGYGLNYGYGLGSAVDYAALLRRKKFDHSYALRQGAAAAQESCGDVADMEILEQHSQRDSLFGCAAGPSHKSPSKGRSIDKKKVNALRAKERQLQERNKSLQRRLQRQRQMRTVAEVVESVRVHVPPAVAALVEAQLRMSNIRVCLALALATSAFAGLLHGDLSHGAAFDGVGAVSYGAGLTGAGHAGYAVAAPAVATYQAAPGVTRSQPLVAAAPAVATYAAAPAVTRVATAYQSAPSVTRVYQSAPVVAAAPAVTRVSTTYQATPVVANYAAAPAVATVAHAPAVASFHSSPVLSTVQAAPALANVAHVVPVYGFGVGSLGYGAGHYGFGHGLGSYGLNYGYGLGDFNDYSLLLRKKKSP
ncbi:hypothetical protein HPB47_004137, partial [Ixodes persulcatus]